MIKSRYHLRRVTPVTCLLWLVTLVGAAAAQNSQATTSLAPPAGPATGPIELVTVTAPDGPAEPRVPERLPPARPKVIYTGGLLKIDAFNSTLADILAKVAALTGAELDVPPSASRERMAADLGPGPPRQILATLLSGTSFDYVISAPNNDPQAIRSVLVTARGQKADATNGTVVAAHPSRSPYPRRVEAAAVPEPEPSPETPVAAQPESSPVAAQLESSPVPAQPESTAEANSESPLPEPALATLPRVQGNIPPTSPVPPPAAMTQQSMNQQLLQMYQQRQQQMREQKAAQRNP